MDATFLKDVTPGAMATSTPIPKGDKKREAGSPLEAQQDVQKKTRHATNPDQNTFPNRLIHFNSARVKYFFEKLIL